MAILYFSFDNLKNVMAILWDGADSLPASQQQLSFFDLNPPPPQQQQPEEDSDSELSLQSSMESLVLHNPLKELPAPLSTSLSSQVQIMKLKATVIHQQNPELHKPERHYPERHNHQQRNAT